MGRPLGEHSNYVLVWDRPTLFVFFLTVLLITCYSNSYCEVPERVRVVSRGVIFYIFWVHYDPELLSPEMFSFVNETVGLSIPRVLVDKRDDSSPNLMISLLLKTLLRAIQLWLQWNEE